jgi:hypothetical protein
MSTRDALYEEMAQWIAIQTRERDKYRKAYEKFEQLKTAYLTDSQFTRPNADKNNAWLRDSRTQDAITAMKDAWECMQAANATVQVLLIQLNEVHGPELQQAKRRLIQKAYSANIK